VNWRYNDIDADVSATGSPDRTTLGREFLSPGVRPDGMIHIEALTRKKQTCLEGSHRQMPVTTDLLLLLVIALPAWGACGTTMGIGLARTTLRLTLTLHALVAVAGFGLTSWLYFSFADSALTPLQAALAVTTEVVALDVFIVALLILKSFDMFRSLAGTWLPLALIFASFWAAGHLAG